MNDAVDITNLFSRSMFEIVKNDKLRRILERDYSELEICATYGAIKSSVVLSGCITECILLDFLNRTRRTSKAEATYKQYHPKNPKKITEMMLGDLIFIAEKMKIITKPTLQLCGLIKDYRNLVHPGKEIRSNVSLNPTLSATVKNLVTIVIDDLLQTERNEGEYGSENVIRAISLDKNADSIISRLVKGLSSSEKSKLFKLVPEFFKRIQKEAPNHWALSHLKKAFLTVHPEVSAKHRKEIMERLLSAIKEADIENMHLIFDNFFVAQDLQLLPENEQLIIFDYYYKPFSTSCGNYSEERIRLPALQQFASYVPPKRRRSLYLELLNLVISRFDYSDNFKIARNIIESGLLSEMAEQIEGFIQEVKKRKEDLASKYPSLKDDEFQQQTKRLDNLLNPPTPF